MRYLLIIFFCLTLFSYGQTDTINYVWTRTYTEPNSVTNLEQSIGTITYYDGLGRPIQKIDEKASGDAKNLITHIEYDDLGRQQKKYLPYKDATPGLNFVDNALSATTQYYLGFREGTSNPYTESIFEPSPLNRVQETAAPGNSWDKTLGHTQKFLNDGNAANSVLNYVVNLGSNYNPQLSNLGYYPSGALSKTIIKDENWTSGNGHTTEEYKNLNGQLILKRIYNLDIPHDTYYIYDEYGNLTYVLPPNADTNNIDGTCYQYVYDYRNRLIEKKIPGKNREYIVYDKLDRVVATGPVYSPFTDVNLVGTTGWMISKYDIWNRTIITGWMPLEVSASQRAILQQNYNSVANTNVSEKKLSIGNNSVNAVSFKYTNGGFPTSGFHILTVNYFDNYNLSIGYTLPSSVLGQPVYYTETNHPIELPTATWVRVLETTNLARNEWTCFYYDEKDRMVRSDKRNYLQGRTIVDSKYDFVGKVTETYTTHRKTNTSDYRYVREVFEYDFQQRLLNTYHKIDDNPMQRITSLEYDDMGAAKSKRIGGDALSGQTCLQKIDYQYNIRGWLTDINNIKGTEIAPNPILPDSDPYDLFRFKINYDSPELGSQGLHNGNISEIYWRSDRDNITRGYLYTYDDLNRLTRSQYVKNGNYNAISNSNFDEIIEYDKVGNISHLKRFGDIDAGPNYVNLIDYLNYSYDVTNNPNRLIKVTDESGNTSGYKDSANLADDFAYDDFGNMISDADKGITAITYNHLNLPTTITIGGSTITILYNANGVRLRKSRPYGANGAIFTDYVDGFQYGNNNLLFIQTSEGYVDITATTFSYVYHYTDHLGNIRLSFGKDEMDGSVKILEENNYYPFGLKHQGYNVGSYQYNLVNGDVNIVGCASCDYKYKYNGKEWQDELGLNVYDYHNRTYDPAIGRWWQIDPMAEMGRRWSPYVYAMDNPVYFIDPDGMWPDNPFKGLLGAVKNTLKSEYRSVKRAVSNVWNDLKKGVDNFEAGLGGFDFRSDLKSGSSSDYQQKRKSSDVETVDATGLDIAGSFAKVGKDGKTGDGMTNATKKTESAVKDVKKVVEKFGQGQKDVKRAEKEVSGIATLAKSTEPDVQNQAQDTITYTVEGYSSQNPELRAFMNADPVGSKNAQSAAQFLKETPEIDSVVIKKKYD